MQENQRVIISKKMLKDGMLKLMETKDVIDITIKEICETGGINRSTFYRHYNNQMELLNEIIDDVFEPITNVNLKVSANITNSLMYIHEAIQFFYIHREYDSLLLSTYFSSEIFYKKLGSTMMAGYKKALGRKKIDEVELNYTIRFLCYGSYSIMRDWIARNRQETPEMIAEMVFKLSTGGAATQSIK